MFNNEKPVTRHFTLRVIILELVLFVATMPWYAPRTSDHFTWIICALLAGYTSYKDYKNGFFDKQTILYIVVSLLIIATTLYFLLFYHN